MSTTVLPTPLLTTGTSTSKKPGLWTRVWAALEAHGQRRAAAELRRLALIHPVGTAAFREELLDCARRAEAAAA